MIHRLTKYISLAALSVTMVTSLSANADAYDEALAAYDAGKYNIAFVQMKPLAEAGDKRAQFHLGRIYDNYHNTEQAFLWYGRAAEQGLKEAQFYLGLAFYNGDGTELDYSKAFAWFRKSAEQGYADAENSVGIMYKYGDGVSRDYVQAVAWFRKAAKHGAAVLPENLNLLAQAGKQSSSPFPATPPARPGYVTCNTQCNNGDCFRTYSDGRQVRFQAEQKWNPFKNQFEWDSGSC